MVYIQSCDETFLLSLIEADCPIAYNNRMSERERVQHLGLQLFGFVIMSVSMMFMCAEMFKRRTAVSVRITLVVVTVCVVGIAVAIVIAFAMALRRASRRSRKQKSTQRKHKQTKEIELPELTEDRQPSATHTIAPPSMLDDDSDIDESLSLNTTVSAKSPAISLARPHQPPTASNSPHNEQKSDKLAGKDTAPSAKMPVFEKDSKFRPSLSQNVVRHTPEEPSQLTQRSRKVASNHRNQVSSTIQAPPFHATLSEDKPSGTTNSF